jgi:hypothetical protein
VRIIVSESVRDPGPVDDDDAQEAAEGLTVSAKDAAAYKESLERGAAQKGEGAPEV